ncbi:MAG TPA: TetR/AcrR family transcriptional regulator [Polyangiaceae bacterium]|nr:TetR/AcrR family transcriptional regulator [Polyangiaceae bacterium]
MARGRPSAESGRVYAGESAVDRIARQRQQFMAAGLELFGTLGYRATTVRMLCKQAGLIDRYFYKNFKDTEDLLAAVYSEATAQIEAEVMKGVAPALASRDPERAIEAGLDAFFKVFENSRVARVCWLEVGGVSPRIEALHTRRIEQFGDLLLSMTETMLPVRLTYEEARIGAIAVVGAVSQSALFWFLSHYKANRKVLVSATARVLRGTLSALRSEKNGKRIRRAAPAKSRRS